MKDIAEMLYKNYDYTGLQEIKIMSCYAASEKYKNNMADLLFEELNKIYAQNKLNLILRDKVEAVCKYTTIVIDFFGKALVADKHPVKGRFNFFNELEVSSFYKKQSKFEKERGCEELALDSINYQQQLEGYKQRDYIKDIAGWNYKEFFGYKKRSNINGR